MADTAFNYIGIDKNNLLYTRDNSAIYSCTFGSSIYTCTVAVPKSKYENAYAQGAITFDSSNNMYFADFDLKKVFTCTKASSYATCSVLFTTSFNPTGIAINSNSSIFVNGNTATTRVVYLCSSSVVTSSTSSSTCTEYMNLDEYVTGSMSFQAYSLQNIMFDSFGNFFAQVNSGYMFQYTVSSQPSRYIFIRFLRYRHNHHNYYTITLLIIFILFTRHNIQSLVAPYH